MVTLTVYSRIVDIENYNDVVDTLSEECQPLIYNKLGLQNALNMEKLGTRYFDMDFRYLAPLFSFDGSHDMIVVNLIIVKSEMPS